MESLKIKTAGMQPWSFRQEGDGYIVFNGSEEHKCLTHSGAMFLRKLFNDEYYWFNYSRHGITTQSSSSTITFQSSNPTANTKITFGDSPESCSTYFLFYLSKPPNAIQRWLTHKLLGIKLTILGNLQ